MIIMDLTVVRVGAGEPDGRWAGRPHHHKEQVLRGWPSRRAEAEETYTDTYGDQVLIWLREDVLVKSIALLAGGAGMSRGCQAVRTRSGRRGRRRRRRQPLAIRGRRYAQTRELRYGLREIYPH